MLNYSVAELRITKKKNEKDNDFFSSDADSNYSISSIYRS